MPKLYEVKVTLEEVKPAVRRRLLIPDDQPLFELGATLIGAMGWNGSHMFAFEIGDQRYEMKFEDFLDADEARDMKGVMSRDVFHPGVEALFHYDFGDDWWHRIEVLDHRATVTGDRPPRCIGGGNACPPDDCGGPYGFEELMTTVANPKHPDHLEQKRWLGPYDRSAFDLDRSNRDLKRALKYMKG
jgi:hypothetical protein